MLKLELNDKNMIPEEKTEETKQEGLHAEILKLKKLGFGGMILPFATYTDLKMYRYVTY